MLEFTDAEIGGMVGSFLWPLFRIMGFFLAAPVLGSNFVPIRVRLILALAVSLLVAPTLPPVPAFDGLSLTVMIIVVQQILIGVALGFFLQMLFQIFVLLGQMIAMQMGLGFASMVDPANGVNVAIVSTFYLMFVTMLFITFDGHLIMIEVIADSFEQVPIATTGLGVDVYYQLISTISWVFSSAVVLALPALTALLMTNFAFGIMTRAAPQMNIFALGFPVALMFGLFVIWLSMGFFLDAAAAIFNEMFIRLRALLD
ncbi:flagellar biosynthetic protein FliR [Pseudohongiella sp.]|uniref:Flagellar biosynthetic protein FliR n=1 Tax=marine sediment metagenome TaxID=412755 RepID=A0A0F9YEU3_9ZZZZ|nr:flagellar biosynthetic protein FliR [Pseudohongiella sp.]HDZ09937.1 flagellar biosynthetic protein FliR [Pseudohongiella sp.]HEA64407.1 flagellar biosynthetic protein FliR [Pseudohongiella sp.]